jgi:hypothetical protein
MEQTAAAETAKRPRDQTVRESLLRRKYVIPFVLACVILACNQATGINSIIGYNTNILLQSGLSDLQAHWGYVLFTVVNFLMTIGGVMLVDRKGRKFLLVGGQRGHHRLANLHRPRCSIAPRRCASILEKRCRPWSTSNQKYHAALTTKKSRECASSGQR